MSKRLIPPLLLAIAALLHAGACTKSSPTPTPGPGPTSEELTCEQVVDHSISLFLTSDQVSPEQRQRLEGDSAGLRIEGTEECERDAWSQELRTCMLAATDVEGIDRCGV